MWNGATSATHEAGLFDQIASDGLCGPEAKCPVLFFNLCETGKYVVRVDPGAFARQSGDAPEHNFFCSRVLVVFAVIRVGKIASLRAKSRYDALRHEAGNFPFGASLSAGR